jgi:hypothetical protein
VADGVGVAVEVSNEGAADASEGVEEADEAGTEESEVMPKIGASTD